MRISANHELIAAALSAALLVATPGYAETSTVLPAPKATTAASPKKTPPPDDLAWNDLGATAQCRDGTYFHGRPSQGTCFNHGGVRKWMGGNLQQ
jgi:hypothetical protein